MHNVLDEFSQLDISHMETIINKLTGLIVALLQSEARTIPGVRFSLPARVIK
ncbi:MAG: hypothetical protein ACFCUM_05790 [Bacteroidales bacterium]